MGWEYVIYMVIAAVISIALAPKPQKPKAATLEDFDVPTAEEGRPVPVIFGTVRVTGPNVLWYGDLSTKKIKQSGLFGSTTIGYKYFLGMHFGICHGPVDAFYKLETGEKTVFYNPTGYTANFTVQVNQPQLYGGKKREGGIVGSLDLCFGESTQTENAYLTTTLGPVPAFRGVFGLVWRGSDGISGGYIGNSPYIKPWAFLLKRVEKGWWGGTVWYSAKVQIGSGVNGKMNPAHIVYEALTNPEWGMGLPPATIDDVTFMAAADTLYTEGFGLCLMWNREGAVEDFIQGVLDHIAGTMAFNRNTGQYELHLLRGDYVPSSLPIYGPESILEVSSYQRQAWGETINELTLNYTDPATKKQSAVTVHDLANIASQAVRIAQTLDMKGIHDDTIATQVAMRELTARSTPIAKVTFSVNRSAWATKLGDVIRLTWPQLGITEMVVRVMSIRAGKLTDNSLDIEGIEDIFSLPTNIYAGQPPAEGDPVDPVYEPDDDFAGATIFSASYSSPPGGATDGQSYLVPVGATGAWAGHDGEVATYDADNDLWTFETVTPGTVIYVEDTDTSIQGGTSTGFNDYVPILGDGALAFTSIITPPALTANTEDYNPTGLDSAAIVRLSATTDVELRGLAASTAGRTIFLYNINTGSITLMAEAATSAAPNRFALQGDVTLQQHQATLLQYDATTSRWRIIGGTGSGGATVTASNLGTGIGIFANKLVNDLQFKSLKAGANISISGTGTEVTINGVPTGGIGALEKTIGGGWTGNGNPIAILNSRPITVYVNQPCTILGWTLIADQAGSAVVDVRKTTLAGLPAGPGDSIAASAKPTITNETYAQDSTLTGWTLAVNAGDVITFQLESVSVIEQLALYLQMQVNGGVSGSKLVGAAFVGEPLTTSTNEVTIYFERDAYINSVTCLGDLAGSAVVDVRKVAAGSLPAVPGDSIVASAPPSLVSQRYSRDVTLTGWDRDITAGDTLTFVLESVSNLGTLTVQLDVTEHL